MSLVILTGMSGAGKTTALHALEDAGFLAVDNLPPSMWLRMAEVAREAHVEGLVIGVDVRAAPFLAAVPEALADLLDAGYSPRIAFLDARDETLVRRFSFTRRTHPLGRSGLAEDMELERKVLTPLRSRADLVIDTTALAAKDLRMRMQRMVGDDRFRLRLVSFGYKRGIPTDVDTVLDVRGFRNPFYEADLRPLPGTDARVQAHVFGQGMEAYTRLREVTRELAESARLSGRGAYAVAIGCTGGQHRSVAVVERLVHDLADTFAVEATHRDLTVALGEHEGQVEDGVDGAPTVAEGDGGGP